MNSILDNLIKNKILLAILAAVMSLGGFEAWKYNQEKHEKLIAEKKANCQEEINSAYSFVNRSKTLNSIRLKFVDENKIAVQHPGVNGEPVNTSINYILMYTKPHALIPSQPRYDDDYFVSLSNAKDVPPPLMVFIKSSYNGMANNGMVKVSTQCSPDEFEVSLNNLYFYFQKGDDNVQFPSFFP